MNISEERMRRYIFHGTTSPRLDSIRQHGLDAPVYLAGPEIADYYAETAAEVEGGDPVLLEIPFNLLSEVALEPDWPGLEEPITTRIDLSRQDVWDVWFNLDPHEQTWQKSLALVDSVKYTQSIPPEDIIFPVETTTATSQRGFASRLRKIASKNPQLRDNIQRILQATGLGRPPGPHYYRYEQGMTIEEVAQRWAEDHEKLYDEHIHGWFSVDEVWPYREYTWSRDTSRGGSVKKDGEWIHMEGPEKWDHIKQQLAQNGWDDEYDPLLIEVGRDGNILLGEGNHRLAIARELGMRRVPVRFVFRQSVRT